MLIDLIDKLRSKVPDSDFHLSAPSAKDGTYSLTVTVHGKWFLASWKPGTDITITKIPVPWDSSTNMPKGETSIVKTVDEAALYIIGVASRTPTKVGWIAKAWLFVRPYLIRLLPKKWRGES